MDDPQQQPSSTSAQVSLQWGARWIAWLTRFKRPLVALAGAGAVLSGLAGWWNAYNTLRNAAGTTPAAAAAPSQKAPPSLEPMSVAILPFVNQTGDAALRSNAHIAEPYWYLAMAYADLGDMARLAEVKARIADPQETAHDLQGVRFKDFEASNGVDRPGYRTLRETRFLPLWQKAG